MSLSPYAGATAVGSAFRVTLLGTFPVIFHQSSLPFFFAIVYRILEGPMGLAVTVSSCYYKITGKQCEILDVASKLVCP